MACYYDAKAVAIQYFSQNLSKTMRRGFLFCRFCLAAAIAFSGTSIALSAPPSNETREIKKPKRLLLIGQNPDNHKRATHEYMAGMRILNECLKAVDGLETELVYAREPWTEGPEMLRKCDGAVFFVEQGARWMQSDPRRYQAFVELASRGGGLAAIHWGVGAKDAKYVAGQVKLMGASRGGERRPFGVFTTELKPATPGHPVLGGVEPFKIHDEFYYQLETLPSAESVTPILNAAIKGNDEFVAWAWQRPDGGRSFGFTGLHYHKNWQSEQYRKMLANAALWIVKLPVPERGVAVEIKKELLELHESDRQPPKGYKAAKATDR